MWIATPMARNDGEWVESAEKREIECWVERCGLLQCFASRNDGEWVESAEKREIEC